MQMRRDANCRRDDEQIFYDVLPFERGHHESRPRLGCQQKERHERGNHVNKQKRNNNTLKTTDDKQNSNKTFKNTEQNKKRIKTHKWNSVFKKRSHQPARGRHIDYFQKTKPEKYDKKTEPSGRDKSFPEKINQPSVYIRKGHESSIARWE